MVDVENWLLGGLIGWSLFTANICPHTQHKRPAVAARTDWRVVFRVITRRISDDALVVTLHQSLEKARR